MALIHRNGRSYIYRSVRRNGRVTSEYGGSGEDAYLISRLETIARDEADLKHWQERQKRKELDELEQSLDELAQQAHDLARGALTAAGYHQHNRGKWRKRRVSRHREG
jgi:hypothetical protein